jgi:hypothetical protein
MILDVHFKDRHLRLSINRALIDKNESGDDELFATGWENVALTPAELATAVNNGHAYTCELSGSRRSAAHFARSDILSVDVDGGRDVADALSDPFALEHLTIFYTTPNHTEQKPRFRLVFALPRPIETAKEMKAALRSLALRMGGDRSATDAARIFFGSRGSNPKVFDRGLTEAVLDELIAAGLDSDQRDGAGTGFAATVSKQPIALERMIQLASGQTLTFAELASGTKVHCPFHYDENASAFVTQNKSGIHGIHCSTCAQTFWPPGASAKDDFADFDNRVREVEQYFAENKDGGPFQKFLGAAYHEGLTQSHIERQQNPFVRLPDTLPDGLVLIKSPKGTGKTEELTRILSNDNRPALLIGHRTALISQSCKRLDLECYLDWTGPLRSKRLGVCVDSLHRLTWTERINGKFITQENLFKTVIIDESEQVLAHFLSDTIEAPQRDKLFKIFTLLLREAKTVVALDADLGWLTLETLSKLAHPLESTAKPKRSTLILNERQTASPIEVFASKDHLTGDMKQAIADGKRVFVTSNSLNFVTSLSMGINKDLDQAVRTLLITSETVSKDEVKRFIAKPSEEALKYDAICVSPSLGTGVDITFPDQASFIDVVYGFFEANITTHFDLDQQLWRVRHPGAVKVWVSPRRQNYDTAVDVVKREIQQKQLYKSVLSHYDSNFAPVYHTDDPLIDMAALATAQSRASKNNLKHNFIALKRRNGHEVRFVDIDKSLAGEGAALEAIGATASTDEWKQRLYAADVLKSDVFDEIGDRMESNDVVTPDERIAFTRTRIEGFYRQPLSDDLIDLDDRGRFRTKIIRYEQLLQYAAHAEREKISGDIPTSIEFSEKLRFVRDARQLSRLLYDLFVRANVLQNGVFDRGTIYSTLTLGDFMSRTHRLKPTIENMLNLEVRKETRKAAQQLGAILKVIGLEQEPAGTDRSKANTGGQKVYRYRLSADRLNLVESLVARREQVRMWDYLNNAYGWQADGDAAHVMPE